MWTMRPVDLIEVSTPQEWHLASLCADSSYDADLWFDDADAARRICAHCPVRNDCLSYAMDAEASSGIQLIGVWGGLSPIQRKRLRLNPEALERMRRVRSRTHLRLLPSRRQAPEPVELTEPVQLALVLEL